MLPATMGKPSLKWDSANVVRWHDAGRGNSTECGLLGKEIRAQKRNGDSV
jgi:hypothetical protein